MIGHFSAGELASFRAGTVSDGKAARISAHLSTCPQCARVHSGLGDVSQLLASIPAPPMPETLTQRLQATIADQAALRVAGGAIPALGAARNRSAVLVPGRSDLPGGARRRARHPRIRTWSSPLLLRGLAAAGVLVLLVGGGILLANQRGVGTATSGRPATRPVNNRPGAARAGSAAATRLRYRHGGQYVYTNAVMSEVNYTRADLPAGVRHQVANSTRLSVPSSNAAPVDGAATPQHMLGRTTVGQLESCLSTVATSVPGLVQLVTVAHYLGRPATIIVFEPVDNAFDVIVVGEACGLGSQDILVRLVVPTK